MTGELHASGLVASVYHRKLPKKCAAFLIRVITVTFGHDWSTGSVTEERKRAKLNKKEFSATLASPIDPLLEIKFYGFMEHPSMAGTI